MDKNIIVFIINAVLTILQFLSIFLLIKVYAKEAQIKAEETFFKFTKLSIDAQAEIDLALATEIRNIKKELEELKKKNKSYDTAYNLGKAFESHKQKN